ncbi:histidinol dehydrogenase [Robiginitalea sp. IMCC44478]|uniref:histidinol dehydrogenase n=1 Tax=Robiginitalea sp. IMCC44478 TaxID=3459122 RepID=UPI004040EB5D
MQYIEYPEKKNWEQLLQRPAVDSFELEGQVREIFNAVKAEDDAALKRYTRKFDGLVPEEIAMNQSGITARAAMTEESLKKAIDLAYRNITAFHRAQQTQKVRVQTSRGVECWLEKKAIQKVGLYIPGGTAPLFSTVLMLGVPAQIAGCREIVLCSPPGPEGMLHPAILYAAQLCGVTTVCSVGGIQAIAAMTYGTASVPAVYKIFGPGNQYVTAAKQWASRLGVAIDMPAGPSELMVVADDTANPDYVAADLLSQAEHGKDSQVVLLSDNAKLLEAVHRALPPQLQALPRKEIASAAIANSRSILLPSKNEIAEMVNEYGPEHLIICHKDEGFLLEAIVNAGSVFLGNNTPESAGDYASGTNHTLPTNGYAKQYSGVNLDSFMKSITYQRLSPEGIQQIGPSIEIMAAAEGLQAHKNAVTLRLENADKSK